MPEGALTAKMRFSGGLVAVQNRSCDSGSPKLDSHSAPILQVHGHFHGYRGHDFSTSVDTKCVFTQLGSLSDPSFPVKATLYTA